MTDPVRAANALTARWAASLADESTAVSGAGVWPLLGFLAAGAHGPARDELAAAVGVPADHAADAARAALGALDGSAAVRAAVGLWLLAGVPVRPEWLALLPPGVRGTLTGDPVADKAAVDAWVVEHTGGLLREMPVSLRDPYPRLVLASALSVKAGWRRRFGDAPRLPLTEGPWAGGVMDALTRVDDDLDAVAVADAPDGPLTLLTVPTEADVDVHLALAEPGRTAADVLPLAVGVLAGAHPVRRGSALPLGTPGPGVRVADVDSMSPEPRLSVLTARFEISAQHDLTERADVFGLTTVLDRDRPHFAGVSPEPLAIGQARQDVVARFTAAGFEAAAVTAFVALAAAGPPPRRHRVREVGVRFDRPFGFLATHRPSGLVLVAGWLAEPSPLAELEI